MCLCSLCTIDLSSNGFSVLSENSSNESSEAVAVAEESATIADEDDVEQIESYKILPHKRKKPLIPDLSTADIFMYYMPSNVVLKYLDLFDSIVELFQSLHPHKVIEVVNDIKASNAYGINYFTDEFIERLRKCTSISSILKILFPYTSWYDHSILRELVGASDCPESIKLLDEFDSRIDVTLPIASYPLSPPSHLMVPDESSSHTVMAVRCDQQLSSLSLQKIAIVKSLLIDVSGVSKHAFVLLAVANHSSAMFFWLIPRNIASIMTRAVQRNSNFLNKRGLLEVAIYPNFSFSTGSTSRIWRMAYFRDTTAILQHVRKCMHGQ